MSRPPRPPGVQSILDELLRDVPFFADARTLMAYVADLAPVGVLHGNVQITTQAIRSLIESEVPITFHTFGGWYVGSAGAGIGHRNVQVRIARHRCVGTPQQRAIAASVVAGKILNQRTLLRRNLPEPDHHVTGRMAQLARQTTAAPVRDVLLGLSLAIQAPTPRMRRSPSSRAAGAAAPRARQAPRGRESPVRPYTARQRAKLRSIRERRVFPCYGQSCCRFAKKSQS